MDHLTPTLSPNQPAPPHFMKPRYESGCFANLPPTIKSLLTGVETSPFPPAILAGLSQRYDTVILFYIDAFGWRFFEQYSDAYPWLRFIATHGRVARLTSQFPSTTAAHVTCIHTGLPVGQSGVYEWQFYEPQLDAMIAPLLFSFAGTTKRDTLKSTGIAPQALYPSQTIYQDLQRYGVSSYVFQHREYTPSSYSDVIFQGAEVFPYKTLPEALVNLELLLARPRPTSYIFLYFDKIDAIGHAYGPGSPQLEAEIEAMLASLERWFQRQLSGRLKNTLLLLTADHGLVEVDPQTTLYLNLAPQISGFQQYLKRNRRGELLAPGGSCRDMFLYIKEERLDQVQAFLAERLGGRAEVYKVQDLIEQGFFGPPPLSATFLARVGNLVILPYAHESVWWYEQGKFEQRYYGHHGGLTPQEVEIPLLLYSFS